MSTNDPVLEVLRAIRGDLGGLSTSVNQLVRHAEYTNRRLDEHGELLRRHSERLERMDERLERMDERFERMDERFERMDERLGRMDERFERMDERFERMDGRLVTIEGHVAHLDRGAAATAVTLGLLHAGVQAPVPALRLGQLADARLEGRVEDCERRLDVLEHDAER